MMLTITRKLAKTLRAVFRKANDGPTRNHGTVVIRDENGQRRVQFHGGAVAVEYLGDGDGQGAVSAPLAALADFEGVKDDPVQLRADDKVVHAEWTDHGIALHRQYPASTPDAWLEPPEEFTPLGDGKRLSDLAEVVACTLQSSIKFSLDAIQLRGKRGEAVGSDGRQLLIARGFEFPWNEDVLVARTGVFDCRQFGDEDVRIGRSPKHVVLRSGPWTIWLAIKEGRYPNVDQIIPRDSQASRVILSDDDAALLVPALSRLPGGKDSNSPVTIHANGRVVIRAADENGERSELVLHHSHVAGDEVMVAVNRQYLQRAVQLGIRELQVRGDVPIVAENDRHTYVWVPLHKSTVLPPTTATKPTESSPAIADGGSSTPTDERSASMNRSSSSVADPQQDRDEADVEATDDAVLDPLQEIDALRVQIREVLSRVNRVSVALKRQRKQAQLVRSTLASLKQLQGVA